MAKKKVSRTEEARRGTKADPARKDQEERRKAQRELEKQAAIEEVGKLPSYYVDPLDEDNLDKRESLTKNLYTTSEIMLCLVIVIYIVSVALELDEMTSDAFAAYLSEDVDNALTLVTSCLQLIAAAIVYNCYKHYVDGDVAYVLYNLVAVMCCEVVLLNIIGIVCIGVLLWRSWKRCSVGLSDYQIDRSIGGKFADLAPSIILFVLVLLCYLLESAL